MKTALRDHELVRHLGAALSVGVGIFLLTNGDRLLAQGWFGRAVDNNMGYVRWSLFDGYQAAGLLGRALVWGTQPLLALMLTWRVGRARTSAGVWALLGIYASVLIAGSAALNFLAQPLARFFGGAEVGATAYFIPGFATAMLPIGAVQGLGIFALASRRYPECWTLGAGGWLYLLLLALVGKPQLMVTYVFGGGCVMVLVLLFLAVVRWGRRQP